MIKKYEIITVEGRKRVKALRSFSVQGRYVNVGDVGGIVYDENTLSQEGNAWIFSGNLNYPSIRVGGDSIVDTNGYEGAVTEPRPFVNITGTSALIGAHEFVTGNVSAAKVLAVGDVEQGNVPDNIGSGYDESKVADANTIRLKSLIYAGGISATVTLAGEGYEMKVLRYGADKKLVSVSEWGNSGATSGAYYIGLSIRKTPTAATVPADITEANVTIPSTAIESTLNIKDSRIVFNYTSAMTVATKVNPGHRSANISPVSNISESNVAISKAGNAASVANVFADVVKCNVEWQLISTESTLIGGYTNVERLVLDGSTFLASTTSVRSRIKVNDCGIFSMSTTVIPLSTFNDVISANAVLTFIRCNVEHGLFYHNPVNRNVYTDIDFAKASADLGKTITGTDYKLASSEVEGMYRIYDTVGKAYGCLVEAYDSVAGLTSMGANSYNTTIYKDAYIRGKFDFAGTNVFGNKVPGHPRAVELKARPRVVQGTLNALVVGSTVTGVVPSKSAVATPIRYRINSGEGISVKNLPGGIQAQIVVVDERNVIEGVSGAVTTSGNFSNYTRYTYAFINFSKTDYTPITPDELGETTITVYNGCKIVNTGTTALSMKGNIRVEDNATLVNTSVTGSGYFGGNSVTENANVNGSMLIKDNAVFAPVAEADKSDIQIHLEGNARFLAASRASVNAIKMSGNSVFSGTKTNSTIDIDLRDNAEILGKMSGSGTLVMEESASIEADTTVIGAITLSGNYKGNKVKTWTGKRTITDVNAPEYDNNVKTKYDF